jgi:flavin-dependent dehydrogenase
MKYGVIVVGGGLSGLMAGKHAGSLVRGLGQRI